MPISETTNYQDTATNIRRAVVMEALLLTSIEMKSFPSTKGAEDVPSISKDVELVPPPSQDIDYESTFTFFP